MSLFSKIKGTRGYLYRNLIAPRWYSWRDRKILENNLALRGKYAGKRCFIIAGGPSVSNIDLAQLRNEYTFVMNDFNKNPQFAKLNPKFYVISDSLYFLEGSTEYWPQELKRKSQNLPKDITMFLGLGAKPFVEKYDLFSNHPLHYIGMQGIFTDNFPFNIALDRYVPYPKNTLLVCLMTATYMGFSTIYLLGCEHNFLSYNISAGKSVTYDHSYEDEISKLDPKNEKVVNKYFRPKDLNQNYEKNIANILQLFRNYKFFYAKAKKLYPGIKIYNATPDSFLDIFPMINFEDIKF
ncbi:MAG: hypothetical protein Q8Q89_01475 [bacterium]|nr:hypothetical protein [bacterium]